MLPVYEILPAVKEALGSSPVVILQAPPGAGKSTVLPLELLHESWMQGGRMVMLEPRRLAARSVAMRMASTLNESIGGSVGYRIRFDTQVTDKTVLEVVTEGILTRMIQSDPSLEGIRLLIFDEFHGRNLQADLALALACQVQQVLRPDLKILIMSATLDTEKITALFKTAPVITSQGKQYPVDVRYLEKETDEYLSSKVYSAVHRALRETEGDILVFLPGTGEIRQVMEKLEPLTQLVVCPLYGDLPFQAQQEAIMPRKDGKRKIVLATSIAETSLTIEGVGVVIDSGKSRVPRFDPRSGLSRLETVNVTVDAADQRAGRAGRLGPGVCYRLWTAGAHRSLVPQRVPEILEADLAPMMLELFNWGIEDVKSLSWITPPPAGAVRQATDLLTELDAIDENKITSRGKAMLRLPTHPRISHMLLSAVSPEEMRTASDVAAVLEERDPLGKEAGADIGLRVEALQRWRKGERLGADRSTLERMDRLSRQWRKLLDVDRSGAESVRNDSIGKLLIASYPERIAMQAQRHSTSFTLANGRVVKLPEHDPLINYSWLCIAQLDAGTKGGGKIFLAAPLDIEEVKPLAREIQVVRWDEERQLIAGVKELRMGVLLVESRPLKEVTDDQRREVWLRLIKDKGIELLSWDEAARQVQARMMSVALWRLDESWPDVSDEGLIASEEEWLSPYLQGLYKLQELKRLNVADMLTGMLSWEQKKKIDALAPPSMTVPSGSNIKIVYSSAGEPPVMEVRLQEVFGWMDTPAVNEGKIRVVMHLLSPGYKPVQVTRDLRSFWMTAYHEVKKELKRRYPKHSWPDDPLTATAVRGVRRNR